MLSLNSANAQTIEIDPLILQMRARNQISMLKAVNDALSAQVQDIRIQAMRDQLKIQAEGGQSSSLRPEFESAHRAQSDLMAMSIVAAYLKSAVKTMKYIAYCDTEDVTTALNQVNSAIVEKQVTNDEPAEHLAKIIDLVGVEYVAVKSEAFDNPIPKREIADQALKNITLAMTAITPTSVAEANIRGAGFSDLRKLQEMAKGFQEMIVGFHDDFTVQPVGPTSEWSPG